MSTTQALPPVTKPDPDEIEIRLSDVMQFLKASRWRIVMGTLAGLIIGALYALSKPNVYTAQVTVMPEIQTKGAGGLSNLGSLAGLAGISLDNMGSSDAIRPDLYPNVLQSIPFALDLLKQPVFSQKLQGKMTFQEFLSQINSTGILSWFSGDQNEEDESEVKADPKNFSQAIQITKKQDGLIKSVQAGVSALYDRKTGILTLSAVQQDPVVAATVARLSLDYLTTYITTYRTEKAREQVNFLSQRVKEVRSRYQSAEYALSSYRDRNRSLFSNIAKIDEQRLQADYLLEQSVYNELSKQLEQAKIKVQEETPVFKVLEPPTVPLRKSGPKRTFITIGFCILGALVGLIVSSVKRFTGQKSE